jgi:hypothetical protein
MKVFISWSGNRSRLVAESLREHLPTMLQGLDIFMSRADLQNGVRWGVELSKELESTNFGVICVTPENAFKPWLLFEAGALSKAMFARVCCLMVGDVKISDLPAPLTQFQNCEFLRDAIYSLIYDLNEAQDRSLSEDQLIRVFEKWWPDLEREYGEALNAEAEPKVEVHKGVEEMFAEIVGMLRSRESENAGLAPAGVTTNRSQRIVFSNYTSADISLYRRLMRQACDGDRPLSSLRRIDLLHFFDACIQNGRLPHATLKISATDFAAACSRLNIDSQPYFIPPR